jgi:hypothetical protein
VQFRFVRPTEWSESLTYSPMLKFVRMPVSLIICNIFAALVIPAQAHRYHCAIFCFTLAAKARLFLFFGVGGTSASAPSFAGSMALINSQAGSRQGLASYLLYQIASREAFAGCDSSAGGNPLVSCICRLCL